MRIRLISDLHLELRKNILNIHDICKGITKDNVLVLAGDIGNPFSDSFTSFINDCSEASRYVLYVPGNHEYYGSTIEKTDKKIKDLLSNICNVHNLNDGPIEIDQYVFVGNTMFHKVSPGDQWPVINDYNMIHDYTTSDTNKIHDNAIKSVLNAISVRDISKKYVLVTHHLVNKQLIHDKHKYSPLNFAFCHDMPNIYGRFDLVLSGHTHMHKVLKTSSGRIIGVVNPLGYPNEETDFDPYFTIDI